MQSLKKDTLSYQLGMRPSTVLRNIGSAEVPQVVKRLNFYMSGKGTGVLLGAKHVDDLVGESERDAIIFYMMNHAVSVIRQRVHPFEPLGPYLPVVEEYQRQLSQRAIRMFYYMLLICTRESRHCKTEYSAPLWATLTAEYGSAVKTFHSSIKGQGSSQAADIFRKNPPKSKLWQYVRFLSDVFHKGKYQNAYGGPAWGKVADVLRDYVLGKLTAEMMLDTSFTLAHNTGPIFNKGMLFNQQNNHELIRILDVQRSGQIPQMVFSNQTKWASDSAVRECWNICAKALGDVMEGPVDWYLVEELGSVHKYSSEKAKQGKPLGKGPTTPEPKSGIGPKIPATMGTTLPKHIGIFGDEEAEDEYEDKPFELIEIMPGLMVKKVEVRDEQAS